MKATSRPLLVLLALASCATWSGASANAASAEIEEIVVRGELRETPLSELPSSVSVIDREAILRREAQHLEEMLDAVPNVNYAAGASRGRYLQIRGIGETGQFIEPLNSSVGLIVDHVDFSGIAGVATLYDVDQVEIFRGPQGTLYGANALAGLVNVTTGAPTDAPEGGIDVGFGTYETRSLGARASGPLADDLAGRLAVQRHTSDGWVENDYLRRDDTAELDELTARGKLRWTPSPDVRFDVVTGWIDADNGYDAFSLDNRRDTLSGSPGRDEQESALASIEGTFTAPTAFDVEAVVARADSDIAYGYDEDWVYDGFDPAGYSSTDLYLRERTTTTGEVRLVSKEAGRVFADTTDWVLGIYALSQDEELERRWTFLENGPFFSDFEIERLALFGQTQTGLDDTTSLTVGGRFERHESHYRDVDAVRFDPDDDLWGARLSIDRLVGADTLVYASLARGYKAGGFNADGTLEAELREFDPETLYNLELGAKGSWRDDTLTGRIALFHMWRDDMQVSTSIERPLPGGGSEFVELTANAAEGTNYGLEAELHFRPRERVELFAGLGLLATEYENFVNAEGERLDGREQAHAPEYQIHAGFELGFAAHGFVRAELDAKDDFYYSDGHDSRSDPYELVHVSIGWDTPRWRATLWVRNVGDVDYTVRGYYFGNDPRLDYAPRTYTQLGEPRLAGLSLGWNLGRGVGY
jgi:outer membrane receptor protein involved in Fe transport